MLTKTYHHAPHPNRPNTPPSYTPTLIIPPSFRPRRVQPPSTQRFSYYPDTTSIPLFPSIFSNPDDRPNSTLPNCTGRARTLRPRPRPTALGHWFHGSSLRARSHMHKARPALTHACVLLAYASVSKHGAYTTSPREPTFIYILNSRWRVSIANYVPRMPAEGARHIVHSRVQVRQREVSSNVPVRVMPHGY